MKTYKEYNENPFTEEMAINSVLSMMSVHFDGDMILNSINEGVLYEGVIDTFNKLASKMGLRVTRQKGIVDYMYAAGKGVAEFFTAIISNDMAKAKTIAKSLKKEDVMDFLFKLDEVTLGLFTGKILTRIENITGWKIEANFISKFKSIKGILNDAIKTLKSYIINVYDKIKGKIYNRYLEKLEKDVNRVSLNSIGMSKK